MTKISQITSNYRTNLMISAYKNWIKQGDLVIDVGCGTGYVTKYLQDFFKIRIKGCDVKNYLKCKVDFIKIKNNKIPAKNKSFDVAMLNDVLHHADKETQIIVIKESLRVAKKVLIFEAEPTLMGKITDIILNRYHYDQLETPLTFRKRDDWSNLFKDLNYNSKSIKLKRPLWYPFSHTAFLVAEKRRKSAK